MARHPQLVEIKELKGTNRPDKLLGSGNPNWNESGAIPRDCPSWIADGRTKVAKEIAAFWTGLVDEIRDKGMLADITFPQLLRYVSNYKVWREAAEKLMEQDSVLEYSNGNPGVNPLLKVMQQTEKTMESFENKWGLSPAYQQKINWPTSEAEEKNEFLG